MLLLLLPPFSLSPRIVVVVYSRRRVPRTPRVPLTQLSITHVPICIWERRTEWWLFPIGRRRIWPSVNLNLPIQLPCNLIPPAFKQSRTDPSYVAHLFLLTFRELTFSCLVIPDNYFVRAFFIFGKRSLWNLEFVVWTLVSSWEKCGCTCSSSSSESSKRERERERERRRDKEGKAEQVDLFTFSRSRVAE